MRLLYVPFIIAVPFTIAACSFDMGKGLRIYEAPDPKPQVAPASAAGQAKTAAPATGKPASSTELTPCTYQGTMEPTATNLPELAGYNQAAVTLGQEIAAQVATGETGTQRALALRIRDFAKSPELSLDRKSTTELIHQIIALSPNAPAVTETENTDKTKSYAASPAVTSLVALQEAVKIATSLGMSKELARSLKLFIRPRATETLAAVVAAVRFAAVDPSGMKMDSEKAALDFARRIALAEKPAHQYLAIRELFLTKVQAELKTVDVAREETLKEACPSK